MSFTTQPAETQLQQELAETQVELQRSQERCAGLEEQNSMLTTLYVACQRLHSSLDRDAVLLALREIIANLIGCEEYALFSLAPSLAPDGELLLVDSWGLDPAECQQRASSLERIQKVVETGVAYVAAETESFGPSKELLLTACIPLLRDGEVTGVLALFRLLSHKGELQALDHELFRLLECHVANVLYCLNLHEGRRCGTGAAR